MAGDTKDVAVLERREHESAGYLKKYVPLRRHAPLSRNYVENLKKHWGWAIKACRTFPDLCEK